MKPVMKTCDVCEYTWDAGTWTKCPRCCGSHKPTDPSPAEIRLSCLRIQKRWTKAEERKRRQVRNPAAEIAVVARVGDHMVRRDADGM